MSQGGQTLRRGDIVLVRFPFTDLSGSKRRPAVVLASYPPDAIVAFISSVMPRQPEISDVIIKTTESDFASTGLKVNSVIRLRKLATLEESIITRRLGKLDRNRLSSVDDALLAGLKIDLTPQIKREYQALQSLLQTDGETAVINRIKSHDR
mgnify:CR=1 FL=1